ncbi:MAG: DnaJ domain-containing protein [Xanthomonadales bacterium]|nr:DnaJ domain-containing protein [Xanthomonadales bacterium]
MEYQDYYKILGVERKASQDELKRAYRKLARKYHPDVSKEADATEKFKEVGEAYEVLKDKDKRAAYDQLGANWKAGQQGFQRPPGWQQQTGFGGGHGGASGFSSFFEDLFGGGGGAQYGGQQQAYSARGENIRARVSIDIEDAIDGITRNFSLQIPKHDDYGRPVAKLRRLNVKIPKGIREGQSIRLAGQGSPGTGDGPDGDLLLEVQFKKHHLYTLEGKDIFMNLPLAPWEAALGAIIEVPTPQGKVGLKIAEDSQTGKKMRIKGRGLPGAPAGDFYVVLQVVLPPVSDNKAKALYEKMRDELEFNPREKLNLA